MVKTADQTRLGAPTTGEGELSFVTWLERRLAEQPPKQKGQRTRERLRIATAKVLAEKGYHGLRVTDVTEAAGVAEGSFYVYFKDKTDAALDVLTSLLEDFYALHLNAPAETDSAFEAIRVANRRWLQLCRANPGLIRCVLQLGDEIPEFSRLVHRTNRDWYSRVASSVVRRYPAGAVAYEAALLAAYLLGAMMDEVTRKLIVYPDESLLELLGKLGETDEVLVDAASVLWMRCLYPGALSEAELPGSAAAQLLWRWR